MGREPQFAHLSKKSPRNPSLLLCRICGKPLALEAAKTDDDGHPVHEDCYLLKLAQMRPASNG
jgi:hypothetical protein